MHEIDVDELLDIIKNDEDEIEEYLIKITGIEPNELDKITLFELQQLIKNKFRIRPDQKEKLKDALFQDDNEEAIIAIFASALLDKNEIKDLIKIENNFESETYANLIIATGKVEEYLTPEKIEAFNIGGYEVAELIEATGKVEEYLTPEIIKASNMDGSEVAELIEATGKVEEYLTPEKIKAFNIARYKVVELIKATENIEKYLTPKKIEAFNMDGYEVAELIKATRKVEEYLTPEIIEEFDMDGYKVAELIKATGKVEEYLTPEIINAFHLGGYEVTDLIKATGKVKEYLTPEIMNAFHLDWHEVTELIKATGKVEEYLTPEIIEKFDMDWHEVTDLIKATGNIEKYMTTEKINELKLNGDCIVDLLGLNGETKFANQIDSELESGTYNYEKILEISEIIKDLDEANSGRLSRIKNEIAMQVYELPSENRKNAIERIKRLFLTNNIPTFAQNFLVFQQLNPNFMLNSKNTLYSDKSNGNIPSLNIMNPSQRSRTIFTDLLKINLESNNRNLKKYLDSIEQGNNLFGMVLEGSLQIDDKLPETERQILINYSEILNSIYNQVRKKERENSGELQQDLIELSRLYKIDKFGTKSLPDRIVRTFGQSLGLSSFLEAKAMIESISSKTSERNKNRAKNGQITLKKGDFAKGIRATEYIGEMFQNGSVAHDYLGQNSDHDCTPCDMDCELIIDEGKDFYDTYTKMKTAPGYTDYDVRGKKLGKVIFIFENNENFVKTRDAAGNINDSAVQTVVNDKSKIEYFDNGVGLKNAHGIRTGLGSTRIKCIISDRYVDKLGLEIALNGFYIPVVDEHGEVIFTPEMYDQIREKMQGLSHYGLTEFQLDESAKNDGTRQLIDFIEQSKGEVAHKREMIIQTLKTVIEEQGLKMSTKRELDLLPGIVEVIDTGSTGRGTNEPGDGDFDFMMRMDKSIVNDSAEFKEKIRKALSAISAPDKNVETGDGDFRYKGVSINGLDKKVDVDLTFGKRTDEIEYTTDECIKDRLETIKRNNPEDYKYVVANILLAKRVLKSEGVYKKKNAGEPEPRS